MFENRKYVIISAGDLSQVDFNQVLETSAETCRISVDGRLTFVKYDGDMPPCVQGIESKGRELTHAEILEILSGPEWTPPIDDGVEGL